MKKMKFLLSQLYLLALLALPIVATSCSKEEEKEDAPKEFQPSAFYVINEGQYGKNGSINFYSQGVWNNEISPSLGGTTTAGAMHDGYMYIVSKDKEFLVKMKLADYTEAGRISAGATNVLGANGQAHSFCVANNETGVLTTSNGAFKVNLSTLALGDKLEEMSSKSADKENIIKAGNYIFITYQKEINVYNANDLTFKKHIALTATTGFALSKDGNLWAADENKLVKINPTTLDSEEIALPDGLKVYYNSFAFSPTCLQASTTENALYFAHKAEIGFSIFGKDIYKYNIDSQQATKLFSTPASDKSVYGAGIQVDPKNGNLYLIYTEDGWGEHFLNTNIYIVDGVSGSQKAMLDYSGQFWFPSMILFQ